jgi:type IV pilus assembly protein PilV
MKINSAPRPQSGVMLLEALIAILIFAIGILGIVGLQGTAVKQVSDARFRSDAALLANQLIGQMWLTDRSSTTLDSQFTATGASHAKYSAWKDMVAATLPMSQDPSVGVNHTAGANAEGTVTITIFWQAPGDTAEHHYVAVAQIR